MFDSPFLMCASCNVPVLLDQTLCECAAEHRCGDGEGCPLARYFSGHDFSVNPAEAQNRREHEQSAGTS